ncbi:MAG: hypothetical protein MZV70_63920 [Desulfobacterales bacterium]|nr:hypothetical protein [Desulfobacterales bacterium]
MLEWMVLANNFLSQRLRPGAAMAAGLARRIEGAVRGQPDEEGQAIDGLEGLHVWLANGMAKPSTCRASVGTGGSGRPPPGGIRDPAPSAASSAKPTTCA